MTTCWCFLEEIFFCEKHSEEVSESTSLQAGDVDDDKGVLCIQVESYPPFFLLSCPLALSYESYAQLFPGWQIV